MTEGRELSSSDTPFLSSSDLIGGSIRKQCRIAQSGRSMTEMLGVLAIIGVLSVGAIGRYSYAMDKWRANETVNQIRLRAIDLMSQAAQGNDTLSFSA